MQVKVISADRIDFFPALTVLVAVHCALDLEVCHSHGTLPALPGTQWLRVHRGQWGSKLEAIGGCRGAGIDKMTLYNEKNS